MERPVDNGMVVILCHTYIVNPIAPNKYDKNK
jgi:hypothetical protein